MPKPSPIIRCVAHFESSGLDPPYATHYQIKSRPSCWPSPYRHSSTTPYIEHIPNSQGVQEAASGGEPGDSEKAEMQPALTPGQEAAIVALVRSPTYAAAAKAAGVGERTLRRWMHNDANFRQRLREARAGVFDQAVRAMHLASPKAAGVLDGIAQDAAASQTVRVSAARTLIHYSCRGHEMADIDGRPAELEARIDAIRTYVVRSEQRYERRGAVTPKRASGKTP